MRPVAQRAMETRSNPQLRLCASGFAVGLAKLCLPLTFDSRGLVQRRCERTSVARGQQPFSQGLTPNSSGFGLRPARRAYGLWPLPCAYAPCEGRGWSLERSWEET